MAKETPETVETAQPEEDRAAAAAVAPVPPDTDGDDKAEAEANAWFNEDTDPTAPAMVEPTADADDDGKQVSSAPAPALKPGEPAEPPAAPTKAAPAKAAPPAAAPEPPAPVADDFDMIQFATAELPKTIKVAGKDVDVSAFLSDFSEAPAVIAAVADRIVQKRMAPYAAMMQDIQAREQHERFLGAVEREVPEVRQIAGTKEFRDWVDSQPKPLQELANSNDPATAVFVLRQYPGLKKPTTPTGKPVPPTSPAFERRKAAVVGTLGGRTSARGASTPEVDPDDYEGAFKEPL